MTACGPSVWTGRALQAKNDDVELIGLVCIRPLTERLCSWPSWISARARSHSRLGPEGHKGHLITNALARPFSISSFRLADLGGKANYCFREQLEPSPPSHRRSLDPWGERRWRRGAATIPLVNQSMFILSLRRRNARLITALLCEHGPGDPRELVGKGRSQNIRMQALNGANEPGAKAVLRPVRWPHQNNPGCLDEEHAQVAVAALGDASEDSPVSGRHLFGHEAEPSRIIPPSRQG